MSVFSLLVAVALVQAAPQDEASSAISEAQADAVETDQQVDVAPVRVTVPQPVPVPVAPPPPVDQAPAYAPQTYVPPSAGDRRIQMLSYDPEQIVTLAVSPGFASVVELRDDERVENLVVGNSAGWQVTANRRGDRIIVKPLGGAGTSNLIVLTGSRRYVFVLDPFGESSFITRFQYPQAVAAAAAASSASAISYRFRGTKALFPLAMSDDGRVTTIRWSEQTNLPAIFALNGRKEQLVNGRMVGNDYVIEGASPRYKFRYGKSEATAIRQTPEAPPMTVTVRTRDTPIGESDPRPVVAVPRRGVPGALIAAGGLLAALLLFLILFNQQQGVPTTASGDDTALVPYAPPPPLVIPADTVPAPQYVTPVPVPRPYAAPPVSIVTPTPAPAPVRERYVEPRQSPPVFYQPPVQDPPVSAPPRSRASSGEPALVLDTSAEIPIGTLIPAVLETPIDTSRPGLARAIVARDARGMDGQRVLVPRGSRLIGEYQSDVRSGQNRVLVNWTRLIRPDGASVRLGVPSADEMGAAGIPGNYHSFFLKRFFNATLQTALSVGGSLVGRNNTGNTVVVGNTLGSTATGAASGLFSSDIRPKITVKSGTLFNVFVAREIDLSGTGAPQQ